MATAHSGLDVRVRGIDDLTPELNKIESKIIRFVGAVSASLAAIRIAVAPVQAAADFEREIANVAKTTEFAGEQIQLLRSELLKLSLTTDVTTLDLAKIAAAAGQMGLGREGVQSVVQFTESVSRMSSVLDISAEVAGESVGKILNVFRLPIRDVERIASAFNEVSNNSTARGEELLDVVRRIGDATGAINLQQSLGLAASGIDFGVNPEVVGTSFSKIFAQMNSKAEQFGKLMNMSATNWISIVQNNGIEAFKMLLAQIRTLEPESQQQMIAKLLGGGRIGALVNKFVQDVNNTVLNKNLAFASQGFDGGLSAIREQLTVLNTFKSQFEILKNSIFKAGVEMGDQALQPLTASVARLAQALQSDTFRSFGAGLGKGLLSVVNITEKFLTAVASLNINWENFIRLGTLFLQLKLVQLFGSWLGKLQPFSNTLQSISNRAKEAADATKALSTATTAGSAEAQSGWLVRKLGLTQEIAMLRQLNNERKAASAAEVQRTQELSRVRAGLSAANAAAAAQEAVRLKAEADASKLDVAIPVKANRATAASNALKSAQAKAAADELAIQQKTNAALQAREAQHNARLLAIQQDYETKRRALLATGSRAGLNSLIRERVAAEEAEKTSYARSVTATQAYWSRQLQLTVQGNAAILAANKQALLAANTALDSNIAARSNATNVIAVAGGAQAKAQAEAAELAKSGQALEKVGNTAGKLSAIFGAVGIAFSALVKVISNGARILLSGLSWLFLAYTIFDMVFGVEKLGAAYDWLKEKIGLVSKAERDRTIAAENAKRADAERLQQLDDLALAYDKLRGSVGQPIAEGMLTSIQDDLSGKNAKDGGSAEAAAGKVATILAGSERSIERSKARIEDIQKTGIEGTTALLQKAQDNLTELEKKLALVNDPRRNRPESEKLAVAKQVEDARAAVDSLTGKLEEARTKLAMYQQDLIASAENQKLVAQIGAQFFNEQSFQVVKTLGLSLKAAEDLQKAAVKAFQEQAQKMASLSDGAEKDKAEKELKRLDKAAQDATIEVGNLKTAFDNLLTSIAKMESEPTPGFKKIFEALGILVRTKTTEEVKSLVKAAEEAKKAAIPLTGKNAINIPTRSSGTTKFDAKDREAEARRLAQAELELARQRTRNTINEEKAKFDGLAQLQQQAYDLGLITLEEYYAKRLDMAKRLNAKEIDAKREELAQIQKEERGAAARTDPAEKKRLETSRIRVESEIRVLETQGQTIADGIHEAKSQAQVAFQNAIKRDTVGLLKEGFLAATAEDVFEASFADFQAGMQKHLQELETAAKKGDETARKLRDNLMKSGVFKAADDAIAHINARIGLATSAFDQYRQKLDLLVQAGVLTNREADNAVQQQSFELAERLKVQIAAIEVEMAKITPDAIASPRYQQMLADLDLLKIKLLEIQVTANQTAISINQNITDSLANALGQLEPTFKSLKNTVLGFIRDVARQIQQVLGRELAEFIIGRLGIGGSGGLGGIIAKVLGKDSKANPANKAGVDLANKIAPRGDNAFNPLYVKDVNKALGAPGDMGAQEPVSDPFTVLGQLGLDPNTQSGLFGAGPLTGAGESGGTPNDALGDILGTITEAVGGPAKQRGGSPLTPLYTADVSRSPIGKGIDLIKGGSGGEESPQTIFRKLEMEADKAGGTLVDKVNQAGTSFLDLIQGGLGGIGDALGDLLGSIFGGSGGSSGGGGIGGFFAKIIMTAFGFPVMHRGGIVGDAVAKRLINPAVFRNAMRYHNGGDVGLRPNEVPTVLEKGEKVLTKAQQVQGSGGAVSIRQVLVTDKNFVPDAMASAEGEKVLFTWLQNNRATVKSLLR